MLIFILYGKLNIWIQIESLPNPPGPEQVMRMMGAKVVVESSSDNGGGGWKMVQGLAPQMASNYYRFFGGGIKDSPC